ncbi:DUF896 domain-containing protein [Bacillus sp. FJAT-45350]|uniref:DUF896 domain-containing protein n=1 Tax=Bacillus sp. FJAT-45350 TaxID=2011014 RepID=UPI000BB69966|nr:DUF896 domain-containing protein [Bacillus sp. FJAT-45350]
MAINDKIARINELAKRAKTTGLSKEEEQEQKRLRQEYVKQFRSSFENQLHSVKVVDKKGNDVTPEKLKQSKKSQNVTKH